MINIDLTKFYKREKNKKDDHILENEYNKFYSASGMRKPFFNQVIGITIHNFKTSKLYMELASIVEKHFPEELITIEFESNFKEKNLNLCLRLKELNNEDFKLLNKHNPYILTYRELARQEAICYSDLWNCLISISFFEFTPK